MDANPLWRFATGERTKTCECGGTWCKHCKHSKCRWLRCLSCGGIYDMTARRFFCRDES